MIEDLPTTLLGAGIIVAALLAIRFPASFRYRFNLFMMVTLALVMVHSIFEGQWAKAAAIGTILLLNMEIDQGWRPPDDSDQD